MNSKCPGLGATVVGMALLLVSCAPPVATVVVTAPPQTLVVTATPSPTPKAPSETPTLSLSRGITICLVGEPDTLYLYGGSQLAATKHVMAALYDGPIDVVNYTPRSVILTKIPTLGDGDVLTRTYLVRAGERVLDASGQVVELVEGTRLLPAGCHDITCERVFTGESLLMEKMEVTFTLRDDITWADGEPLTAADSVFAYEIAADPDTPGDHYLTERTASYRAVDKWHVKWIGIPGFLDTLYMRFFFAPLPRHQLRGYTPEALLRLDKTRRTPLGWGPFTVQEWAIGDHITLVRNPHYFRTAEGLPRLDRITFLFATDAADAAARVLAHECDMAVSDGYMPYLPLLTQAEQRGLIHTVALPSDHGIRLDFNLAPTTKSKRPPFFTDVRVRRAVAQCIDRDALVGALTEGQGMVAISFLPATHPLNQSEEISDWPYDPYAALRLLEGAGWVDRDGDGVSEARQVPGIRDGTPFDITLLVPSSQWPLEEAARLIRANLADCGIRVTVETYPLSKLLTPGSANPILNREFDLLLWEWKDDERSCRTYLSEEIPSAERPNGTNIAGYFNLEYDRLCDAAMQAQRSITENKIAQSAVLRLFLSELPGVPLIEWPRLVLTQAEISGIEPSIAESELWNVEQFDVSR